MFTAGINYSMRIPWYCCPKHHRTSLMSCSLLESAILGCRLPWVFSKHKPFLMQVGWRLICPYHAFSVVRCPVQLWHQWLCIWALVSVISGLANAVLLCLLDLWSPHSLQDPSISSSAITSTAGLPVYDDPSPSVNVDFAYCASLMLLSSLDSCLLYNLWNCHSWCT
jgi:hypothetical protein